MQEAVKSMAGTRSLKILALVCGLSLPAALAFAQQQPKPAAPEKVVNVFNWSD